MAFAYYRTLTVTGNAALLPSTQTDFPVLVYISDATLKVVGSGGHIQNSGNSASGPVVTMPYDLIFTSNSAGTIKIPWEVDFYDGTAGVLWAWVKLSSCALSTLFYVFYGDVALNSAQNTGSFTPANVWNSNYKGVFHLADGTTLNVADSTAAGIFTPANNGATAAAGQIDGCAAFNAQNIGLSGGGTHYSPITFAAWARITSFANAHQIVSKGYNGTSTEIQLNSDTAGKLNFSTFNPSAGTLGATAMSTGTWYHCVGNYDATNWRVYLNGVVDNTTAGGAPNSTTQNYAIGAVYSSGTPIQQMLGSIDEVRISDIARSADWIKAEYNSQLAPGTFVVVGSEITRSTLTGAGILQPGNFGINIIGGRD